MEKNSIYNLYNGIVACSILIVGIWGGACLYNAEKDANEARKKQYNSLPEKVKPYDINKDGTLQLDEINRLEKELLR